MKEIFVEDLKKGMIVRVICKRFKGDTIDIDMICEINVKPENIISSFLRGKLVSSMYLPIKIFIGEHYKKLEYIDGIPEDKYYVEEYIGEFMLEML